jgi:EcsC protein family
MPNPSLAATETDFLREAAHYLERPSYLMRVADALGQPLQQVSERIVPHRVLQLGDEVLRRAMSMAAGTVRSSSGREDDFAQAYARSNWTDRLHLLATVVTGSVGGLFGIAGLTVELPLTTSLMLRSIASIADDFGEDLKDPTVRLECLSVLSLGGPGLDGQAMPSSYLTARVAMARLIQEAAEFIAGHSARAVAEAIAHGTVPVLVRYLARVGTQFNVTVSQKFLMQSLPIIGVGTGALINAAFSDHFNSVARFHFGIRKLERRYGSDVVRAVYQHCLPKPERPAGRGLILEGDA